MSGAGSPRKAVLSLNVGSSSLKFAVFGEKNPEVRLLSGKFDRIALPPSELSFAENGTGPKQRCAVSLENHVACLPLLEGLLRERGLAELSAVGHRVVHGGADHTGPAVVTKALLDDLRRLEPFAPNHLPAEVALMESLAKRWPKVMQVACFDTAFHQGLPVEARLLPIPRRYAAQGVRRYGFHGLAFQSVLEELRTQVGELPARIVLAHLGNGASMAAVRNGQCIDTTMGFTPAGGLVMSTRSGDIDPGLVTFLIGHGGVQPAHLERLFAAESGLLGLSETSSDVRDLLEREGSDARAAEALSVFCHQGRKFIGALAAVLGGIDALVFSGGIGENSPILRERLCGGFEFLGLKLDSSKNRAGRPVISSAHSAVSVRIIAADEERILAAAARSLSAKPGKPKVFSSANSP